MYRDSKGKTWYKGNLHLHTKESDGVYTPEEAFALYLSHGYDFVARTDHWKASPASSYKGMLLLSGCEYDVGRKPKDGIYHILAIGSEQEAKLKKGCGPQEMIDEIHKAGGLAGLAHPAWSLNSDSQIAALQGIDFVEIFNSVSDMPRNARPYSGVLLDTLASRGYFYPLAATDDTHFYYEADTCRSFIYVQAQECSREAILKAMRDGRFYASQGPTMDVEKKDGKIIVHTSGVEEIVYFTDTPFSPHRSDVGHDLTYGEYEIAPTDTFVRVEVKDKDGNFAWWQYIEI